jgi:hypothetical protein
MGKNYLQIVLKGFFDLNDREYLDQYFYREIMLAKRDYYDREEFANGCLRVIMVFNKNIESQVNQRKTTLYRLLDSAKSKTITFAKVGNLMDYEQRCMELAESCRVQLKNIRLENYKVDLNLVTKGEYNYFISYDEIQQLKRYIFRGLELANEENNIKLVNKNSQGRQKDKRLDFVILISNDKRELYKRKKELFISMSKEYRGQKLAFVCLALIELKILKPSASSSKTVLLDAIAKELDFDPKNKSQGFGKYFDKSNVNNQSAKYFETKDRLRLLFNEP